MVSRESTLRQRLLKSQQYVVYAASLTYVVFVLLGAVVDPPRSSSQTFQTPKFGFTLLAGLIRTAVCDAVEIGTAPIPPLHVRNPFFSFSLPSDFQVFSTPFNRSPYDLPRGLPVAAANPQRISGGLRGLPAGG
ncbi:hypothetical protein [Deinococcus saxicola]|uniref:hypothetical protein n=1 Tax=Deinococcus saxicola TaxID=249406 RepID=UPI0039EDFCC7